MRVISEASEYAIRAVAYLAEHAGGTYSVVAVAAEIVAPPAYLAKVLQKLRRAKLVTSRRGSHGGFALGADPCELTLLTVVEAIDPIRRIGSCPLGIAVHTDYLCPLCLSIDGAAAIVERMLADYTIAQLLGASGATIRCAMRR